MIRALLAAVALGAAVIGAPAQAADAQGDRMVAAYQSWASRWGVQNSSFAVMRGSKVVGASKVGASDPYVASPLASLSKAITGVCVARLVEKGKLSYSDTIGVVLKKFFKTATVADQAAKNITVAELLTHSSGVHYDPTQGTAEFSALDFSKPNLEAVVSMALSQALSSKTYFYNNADYAALGLVVEAVTKDSYTSACNKLVLKPAGVTTAKMDPDWKIMSSWGGWNLSAVDYARFLDHFRPDSGLMKTKPPAWAKLDLGGGAYYSLGTLLRQASSGKYNFWHSGAWRWFDGSRPEREENYGSYFVVMQQNLRYAATYSPQPASGAINDLDSVMWQAAYPPATVPAAPSVTLAAPAVETNGSDDGSLDIAIGAGRAAR
jgi:CubicO group peptidase (beta-lactamase class C family)